MPSIDGLWVQFVIVAALGKIESVLGGINGAMLRLFRWLALSILAIMTAVVLSGVFFRYVLDDALAWSEEIAKFLMVWMTFVAAPIAYKTGALVAIEAFPRALKGRVREVLLIVIEAIVITLMLVFIIKGTFLAQNASIQRASTIDLSITYVYAAMPVGAFAVLMLAAQSVVASLRYILGGPAPENRFLDFSGEGADDPPLSKD
ncbi:MAG: TRAP-type C4-dicarboxylate transport system permease small subunit [Gammaproteobacteria bacterium]|jgi:TRAP-type C4-dicarboxylate transport system permease small subunit